MEGIIKALEIANLMVVAVALFILNIATIEGKQIYGADS